MVLEITSKTPIHRILAELGLSVNRGDRLRRDSLDFLQRQVEVPERMEVVYHAELLPYAHEFLVERDRGERYWPSMDVELPVHWQSDKDKRMIEDLVAHVMVVQQNNRRETQNKSARASTGGIKTAEDDEPSQLGIDSPGFRPVNQDLPLHRIVNLKPENSLDGAEKEGQDLPLISHDAASRKSSVLSDVPTSDSTTSLGKRKLDEMLLADANDADENAPPSPEEALRQRPQPTSYTGLLPPITNTRPIGISPNHSSTSATAPATTTQTRCTHLSSETLAAAQSQARRTLLTKLKHYYEGRMKKIELMCDFATEDNDRRRLLDLSHQLSLERAFVNCFATLLARAQSIDRLGDSLDDAFFSAVLG